MVFFVDCFSFKEGFLSTYRLIQLVVHQLYNDCTEENCHLLQEVDRLSHLLVRIVHSDNSLKLELLDLFYMLNQ